MLSAGASDVASDINWLAIERVRRFDRGAIALLSRCYVLSNDVTQAHCARAINVSKERYCVMLHCFRRLPCALRLGVDALR